MKPYEQRLHLPATPVAAQNTSILRRRCDAHELVRRDELHTISFADTPIQGIAVVGAVTDHAFRDVGRESLVERGFDELCFMRRSAGRVQIELTAIA
jgi:hypothetical protein